MEKIKELYSSNKVLFYILLPLIVIGILIILFKNIIGTYLAGSAKEELKSANKKDSDIKSDIKNLQAQSEKLESESLELQNKINSRKESDISEDWYKDKK